MSLITNCHVLREMNLTMNNSFNIFRFKIKARDLTTHQIPLHSGEPRAQHAPRGPDGCLLPSLQLPPLPTPPHPNIQLSTPPPTRPSCSTPVQPKKLILPVPPWNYPSLIHARANTNTHTHTALNNYKLYTQDT